jgi:membrane protease YdiL (CAAX protease family)
MQSALSLPNRIVGQAAYLWKRLIDTPLLWGWLAAGLLLTLLQEGWSALLQGCANLLLLGMYVMLIRALTSDLPAPLPVRRPHRELAAAAALLGAMFLIQLFDFGVWPLQPWQGWVQGFFTQIRAWAFGLGIPGWAQGSIYGAISSTIKQLLPTLILLWLLDCGRQEVWGSNPQIRLAAVLGGITAVFGLLTGVLLQAPPGQVLAVYGIGIFINALPEEMFFRGLLLPRLEKVLANPLNALVISALLFNAIHVPLEISQGEPWVNAVLGIFRSDYPTGLLWGYLYLRTRSILPGVFWHAANGRLGFIFLNF